MKLPADYRRMHWTERKRAREQYAEEQGGKCHHCAAPLSGPPAPAVARLRTRPDLFPPGFFRYPVHLHHDHETGMTIGAVHNHCNAVLWQHHGE